MAKDHMALFPSPQDRHILAASADAPGPNAFELATDAVILAEELLDVGSYGSTNNLGAVGIGCRAQVREIAIPWLAEIKSLPASGLHAHLCTSMYIDVQTA
jgi:hypothetical protein